MNGNSQSRFRAARGIVAVAVLSGGVQAFGPATTVAQDGFKTSLTLGATLTDGNSETLVGNASITTAGERERFGSLRAGIEANYGENTGRRDVEGQSVRERETMVENARLFANARKTLSERTFAYLDGTVQYDDIAAINYRVIAGPGLGTYLLKSERTALSIEMGVSYIWEDVAGARDDYLAARLGQRFEQTLSATARLWQTAEILPKTDDFDDYLLNAELGIEAAVNSRLNVRLVLQDKYDSMPGENLKKNDLTLIAGVRVSL